MPLTVEGTNIIEDVKQQIFVARGYPVAQQVLVYDGRRLADTSPHYNSTVAENGISTNDLLYLTVDAGLPLTISSISTITGMVEVVSSNMTAGLTHALEQSPSLVPTVWSNV